MYALGRSVTIVYECGCALAARVSIMYTFTNIPDTFTDTVVYGISFLFILLSFNRY